MERYEASGRMGSLAIPGLLACLAAGALGAWLYQRLVDWVPLIYVNFLLTLGFGAGLGLLVAYVARASKLRSRRLTLATAALTGLCASAASFWWAYQIALPQAYEEVLEYARKEQAEPVSREEFDALYTLDDWRQARAETGWTVGRVASSGSRPTISGIMVYVIWLLEAGLLVGSACRVVAKAPEGRFCEPCDRWMDAEPLTPFLDVDAEALGRASDVHDLSALLTPAHMPGSGVHGAYTLHTCPGCSTGAVLDVHSLRIQAGKGGKLERVLKPVSLGIQVSEAQAEALRAHKHPGNVQPGAEKPGPGRPPLPRA